MDHRDRELLASEPIRYGAVSTLQRPRDLGFVPVLGVSDIGEAEVVLFGPEERDVIEAFTPAENVARRRLALALGDDPSVRREFVHRSAGPANARQRRRGQLSTDVNPVGSVACHSEQTVN